MIKTYVSPAIIVVPLACSKAFLEGSMKVDNTTPVSNSSDIGFVKEGDSQAGSIWDNEW